LTTSKPPQSLKGGTFLDSGKVNIERIQKPKVLFKGGIKKAIQYFPRNINVAATIFLASQFQDIEVVIKVDPALRRNTHSIEAISEEASIKIEVENIPSQLNPKTSYLAILSTQALLEKITSNIKIGT
jgi:aspartate dehydrogenase